VGARYRAGGEGLDDAQQVVHAAGSEGQGGDGLAGGVHFAIVAWHVSEGHQGDAVNACIQPADLAAG
jgi:hypothetical protein